MGSETWGVLVAAIITALASLVGVALSRRTTYRRRQLQDMRDEAELLAMLPDSHPMRDPLSDVLEARLNGYTRLFEAGLKRPESPVPSALLAMAGTLLIYVALFIEWETFWNLINAVIRGDQVSIEWQDISVSVWGMMEGVVLYLLGIVTLMKRVRSWRWARAMRGERILEPPTWGQVFRVAARIWRRSVSIARQNWSRMRRRTSGKPDPAGSQPDA